jgi:hypothetical protein
MAELHRDFFISPAAKRDDIEETTDDQDERRYISSKKKDNVSAMAEAIRKKNKKFNWDNHLTPEATLECLDDARLRRTIIRRAARYIIDKCKEEDMKKEAEIKARNDEKEIAAWFN